MTRTADICFCIETCKQSQYLHDNSKTSVKRETCVKNGRYIPSWISSVCCRFTCGLVRVGCAKTTLDMFWTARALGSTVGQTGPCTFNTNVQNATDTYLNWSLEYLGWGLVWQESEKYVWVLWAFLQVKWNMGASCILLGAIGRFACCLLVVRLLVQTELIARQQIYSITIPGESGIVVPLHPNPTLHSAIFLANSPAICWLHLFHQLKGATRNGSWVIYWGRIQVFLIAISEW